MKCPKYNAWCKQNVISTIKKQIIDEDKEFLQEFVFNPKSDLYSNGVYKYTVSGILWIINGDPDNPSKSLFCAVQHRFCEKYFQKAQEINPEMDMKAIRHDGGECLALLFETLDNITISQLKDAVMYAFDYGTEELEAVKISYVKTIVKNIAEIINKDLTEIEGVHIDYLNPAIKRKNISVDKFVAYLINLSQSGIFANTINWRYEELFDSGKFLIEGDIGHNNGYELNVVMTVKNIEDRDKVMEILQESEE